MAADHRSAEKVQVKGESESEVKKTNLLESLDVDLNIDLNTVPVRVINVKLDGIGRTKTDYVQDAIKEVFTARTFDELIIKTGEAQQKLRKLEVFQEVCSLVDTSKVPNAPNDAYEVTFLVKEENVIKGTAQTMFASNEGSLSVVVKLPNVLGRGEKVTINHLLGSSSSWERNSELTLSKPFPNKNGANLITSLLLTRNPHTLSGYDYSSIGTLLGYNFKTLSKDSYQVQWEGTWRQILASSLNTPSHVSLPVREHCGHSIKSAMKFILNSDKRDHALFPNFGYMIKFTSELAGFLGDAKFWKNDLHLQHNQPLFKGIVFQSSVRGGFLQPFGSSASSSNISDHFFIGGPQTLRGFTMKGVGPRDGQNSLGGKAYWLAALHLYSPLPFNPGGRFASSNVARFHAFINAGSLSTSLSDEKLWTARASYGLGLTFRMATVAKLELNYCWPLRSTKGDQVVNGFQFGIGMDFL